MSGELNFDITVQLAEAVASFDELSKKSEDLKRKLDELSASRADPRAELKDYELVKSEMDELKAKIDLLNAATASPDVVVQHIEETKVKLDEAKAKLDELGRDTANPDVSLKDAEVVKAEIDDLETKLRFLGAVKANPEIAVKDVERTKAQIGEVHQKLDDLDLRASNMILDIRTDKAKADIGAFATEMTAKINAAIKAIPSLELKADASEVDTTLAEIRTELTAMRGFTIKGQLDGGDEMLAKLKAIEEEAKALSDRAVTIEAKFNAATVMAQLAALRTAVEKKLELTVDTTKANTEIGAFATSVRTKIEAAIKALPKLTITADSTQAEQKLAAVRTLLESLKDKKIGIDITKERFDASMAVINAELAALGHKEISIPIKVDADTARNALKGIGSDIDNTKGKVNGLSSAVDSFASLMSTKMGLIGGSVQPLLASIGQLSGALGLLPSIAAAVGQGFAATKIGIMGVSESIKDFNKLDDLAAKAADANAEAQKAQAAATQASTAAGKGNVEALKEQVQQGQAHVLSLKAQGSATKEQKAAIAEAQQQLDGYKAALINATSANQGNTSATNDAKSATDTAKTATSEATSAQKTYDKALDDYRQSLTNLAPAAADFVVQIAKMSQTFKDLKLDVQQHLFEGLATSLQSLSSGVLPTIRTGLDQMADSINKAVKNVATFVTQQSSVSAWKEIFANNALAASNLANAIKPILQIITDVTQVGSSLLPGLATGFANAAQKAADFVSKAKDTGQLKEWIQAGITALGQLWTILKNVVEIIAKLSTASGFSPSFLATLATVTSLINTLLSKVPLLTSAVNLFFAAWVFAKVITGITGLVTSISGIGVAIDAQVAKLAALTGAETAAGTAATGVAAGLSGMLLPLAALGVAIGAAVTHWQAFIQGFKDMGAVLSQGVTDITSLGKAVGDVFTGDFGAAGRALDDSNKKFQDLRTQLNDHSGFDSAKQGADGLTASIEKTSQAMSASATAITGSISAEVGYKAALDGVTTSVAQNTNSTDLNTAAGRNNVTAVANLISSAQQYEAAQKTAGASDTELTTLHNTLATAIQGVITKLGLTGPEVDKMVAAFTAAKPALDLKATLDTQGVTAGVAAAKAALAGLPSSWQVKIAGEAADLLQKVSDAGAAIKTVPETHMTTFTGDGANLLAAAAGGTTAISGVVPDWLTKFAGDTSNLLTAATTGEAALEGVQSTHGSSFTGDVTNLTAAATSATTAITAVAQPAPTVFTADITDITTKTGTATTQIAAVAATHATTFTGDLTGTNGVTQAASTATTQINAIPATHQTTLTIDDAAALQAIQQFTAAVNAIPTTHVTTLSTVQGAAGGGIFMKMAIGGIVPLAQGGYTPMSASRPAIVPPNTMRLIGDRPVGDEAFIPINNSGASTALLGETAKRMNYKISPMYGGGRSWDDDDDDRFWDWWRRGGGGKSGGPSSSGSTLTPSAAATQQMYRATSGFQAVGGAASISSMKAYHQNNRPPPAAAASSTPPPVNIHCDSSNLGRLLFELFRNSIRAQGGNVQVALGS